MKNFNIYEDNDKLFVMKNDDINNFHIELNYYDFENIFDYIIKKKYIIKIISLLFLCIFSFNLIYNDFIDFKNNKNSEDEEIYINYRNDLSLKHKYVKKFNSFINLCLKSKLENNIKYPLVKNPLISVIIPIYNGGQYLYYSLRSVQNQKMKNLEIILIDDKSNDNTLNIIKTYMEEDERIRLIKNNQNRKILYSKSIGALNSKGKYIIELDQDDMFIRNDCFDILFSEAEKNNLDLVHIRDFSKTSFKFDYITKVNLVNQHLIYPQKTNFKQQPSLKDKIYIENNIYLLWGLLIRSDIYKKAIYHLWPIIMNYQLTFHEDYAVSFMLIILAKRYKYLNKFGLLHVVHLKQTSNNYKDDKKYYLSVLFVSNIIYEYHIKDNPKDIGILKNYILLFIDCFRYGKKFFPYLFQYIYNIILNNEYLSNYIKTDLLNLIENNLDNLEFNSFFDSPVINTNNYNDISFIQKKNFINEFWDNIYHISIIIYCTELKFLSKTIESILEQIYIKIEIIIIYDNIEIEDSFYIQNYIKKFNFIKLITNKYNRGIIYSISLGVLKSIGKHILFLQPGYILFKENSLYEIYLNIIKNKSDILEFNIYINNSPINSQKLILYKCLHIQSNINLNSIKYNKLYKGIDQEKELLFNKLINADLFKNVINENQFIKYNISIYNYYDNILIFSLMNKNIKFEHVDIPGVIKNNKDILELNLIKIMNDKAQKIKDSIFYIDYLFKNTNDSYKGKKYALDEYLNILSLIFNKFNNISHDSMELFNKFNNSNLINNIDKTNLNFYYNSLIN